MLREVGRLVWTYDVSLGNSPVSAFAKGAGGWSSLPHSNTWTGKRSISVIEEFVSVLQGLGDSRNADTLQKKYQDS